MTLLEHVEKDITDAMRARDQAKLVPLRMLKSALVNREIEKGRKLEENEARQVVSALVKQRRDSIDQFTKGGRTDLADREVAEIGVLEGYVPPAVEAGEVEALVERAIAETGASSPRDFGAVMKAAMAQLSGRTVDGKMVSDLVRRKLNP